VSIEGSVEYQRIKLNIKQFLLTKLYYDPITESKKTIDNIVSDNAHLLLIPQNKADCFYIYYRGNKYFNGKPSLDILMRDLVFTKQMDLHVTLKDKFIKELADIEELSEEQNIIDVYLSHLLSECNTLGDLFSLLPESVTKVLVKPPGLNTTLSIERINTINKEQENYSKILQERIFINLLMRG